MIQNFTNPYWVHLDEWNAKDADKARLKMQHMGTYAWKYFYKKDINDSNKKIIDKLTKKGGKVNLSLEETNILFP